MAMVVRGALPLSFPAVWLRTPLGAGLLEKFSPLDIEKCFRCCVLGQGTSPPNASFDSGGNYRLPGRTGMAMFTMFNAPKWLQHCVLSVALKWINGSSQQGEECTVGWMIDLQTSYQTINLHIYLYHAYLFVESWKRCDQFQN